MKKIVLVFDEDNNFDPVGTKNNTLREDKSIILNVSWFINCAMEAVRNNFSKDSERYLEMGKLFKNMKSQVRDQVTEDTKIKSISLRECYTNEELLELSLDNPNDAILGALIRSKVI